MAISICVQSVTTPWSNRKQTRTQYVHSPREHSAFWVPRHPQGAWPSLSVIGCRAHLVVGRRCTVVAEAFDVRIRHQLMQHPILCQSQVQIAHPRPTPTLIQIPLPILMLDGFADAFVGQRVPIVGPLGHVCCSPQPSFERASTIASPGQRKTQIVYVPPGLAVP